jgi:integrase
MKNKTTKQGCAGKSSNNGFKTPTFQRVKDSKGKPIRGVWIRGKQFYARLFIDNGSGQKIDRRVPLEAKTVQDARRELEQLKYLGKTSNFSIRQSQPFNSFRDHYLDSIANMKRKRTYDSENQHLKQWNAFFGNLPIHQISREKIIKYRTAKIKVGWAGRTANLSINNLLNHAKDNGLIDTLPTTGLKPIRWKPKKRPLFAPEQIESKICRAALQNCKHGQLLADYVRLMKTCGSRASETLRLKWSDLDWDRKQLIIGSDGLTKNHESRVVDFNPALETHLLDMNNRRNGSAYLFPSPKSRTTDNPTKTLKGVLHKARDIASVEGFGFHDCRHYFISHAVMSGIDYMTIAKWIGHKDGGVLIGRVYGHLNDEHAKRQAKRLRLA